MGVPKKIVVATRMMKAYFNKVINLILTLANCIIVVVILKC